MDRLRYRSRKPLRFQRREGRVEHSFRRAKFLKQLAGETRPQARGERERHPAQILIGIYQQGCPGAAYAPNGVFTSSGKYL